MKEEEKTFINIDTIGLIRSARIEETLQNKINTGFLIYTQAVATRTQYVIH